ncbi:hypothetical protein QBC39DRAFT_79339 [Podospora conica]|nr:hypothetical protein QBC39DRAFT_79339 [Schizothecium conicum]
MDVSSHMGAVAELDLSASCGPNTIVDRINAMPALKTSTAFFTFLRANLVLPHSSSNVSTPYLAPVHTSLPLLPPRSPSPLSARPPLSILDDDVPPLSLSILTTPTDKSDALALITDSIIQQRHQTALSIISHPLVLTILSAALFTIHQYAYVPHAPSFRLALLLVIALFLAFALAVHRLSSGYLSAAAAFSPPPGDIIIGTRLGPTLVGALILHLEPTTSTTTGRKKQQHHRTASLRGGKGVIRAWTVRRGYRGQGFGAELLREAARLTRERCGAHAEIGFAAGHANSTRVLPDVFNGGLRRGEVRAARALEGVVGGARGKR